MPSPGLQAKASRASYALERLRRIGETPYESYISDRDLMDIAERNMQVLLEAILDVAGFVVARESLGAPTSYRETMEALISSRKIPVKLARLAYSVAGMRNILVHGYAEVRHDLLYNSIRNELDLLAGLLNTLLAEVERLDP